MDITLWSLIHVQFVWHVDQYGSTNLHVSTNGISDDYFNTWRNKVRDKTEVLCGTNKSVDLWTLAQNSKELAYFFSKVDNSVAWSGCNTVILKILLPSPVLLRSILQHQRSLSSSFLHYLFKMGFVVTFENLSFFFSKWSGKIALSIWYIVISSALVLNPTRYCLM